MTLHMPDAMIDLSLEKIRKILRLVSAYQQNDDNIRLFFSYIDETDEWLKDQVVAAKLEQKQRSLDLSRARDKEERESMRQYNRTLDKAVQRAQTRLGRYSRRKKALKELKQQYAPY